MVHFQTGDLEQFLHRDTNRRAAAPNAEQEGWPEAGFDDAQAKFIGIAKQLFSRYKCLVQPAGSLNSLLCLYIAYS